MKSLCSIFIFLISILNYSVAQDINASIEKMSKKEKGELLSLIYAKDGKLDKKLKKAVKKLSQEELTQILSKVKKATPTPLTKAEVFKDVKKAEQPLTKIEFKEMEYDFGEATEGDKVTYVYQFKNTGKKPLIITNAKGSCGCTVPKWPKDPIKPGKKGEIEVVFNTKNKKGKQTKIVTITANTDPPRTVIKIKGEVKPAIKK